jgi:PDZ domain-containing secreted protein
MKNLILVISLIVFVSQLTVAQSHQGTAMFGIQSNPISKNKAKKLGLDQPYGAYITNIIGNTTAEKEGFQRFDYITKVDEYELKDDFHFSNIMKQYKVGDQATIYYTRNGKELKNRVTFGNSQDAQHRSKDSNEDPFLGIEANHSKNPSGVNGVSVDIVKNSTAEDLGLQDDDIITKIDDIPMIDWHDISAAIDNREVGELIKVAYYRDSQENTATLPIKSLATTKNNPQHNKNKTDNTPIALALNETPEVEKVISDMDIDMEDMPKEDAQKMEEELGIKMPTVQNLSIEQLNIFPNPTQGLFNLKFDLPEEGATAIRIFDNRGVLVFRNDLGNFSGNYSGSIDLGNQPAGTYYVMIKQENLSVSKKVIVSRN